MRTYPVSILDLSVLSKGQTSADALAATLEVARAADRLGAHRFWVAEHHNMSAVAATSPAVLASAIGAVTERIRIGSGGVMLPNHSPYVIAEQFAMLEALYPGRVDLGLGRAPGADQVTAWALRRTQEGLGPHDYAEHVGLIQGWLSPGGVRVGQGMRLLATPVATDYPEIWLLGSSDHSARLAGQLGVNYAYADHFGSFDPVEALRLYRSSFQPSRPEEQPRGMVCTSALVGPSAEEAEFLAAPSRLQWHNLRSNVREAILSPQEATARLASLPEVVRGGTKHVGTAEVVLAELDALAEASGADEMMVVTTAHDLGTRLATVEALLS